MSKTKRMMTILMAIVALIAIAVFYIEKDRGEPQESYENIQENNVVSGGDKILAAKADLIKIKNLKPGDRIESPLLIEGEARGTWFFEASFPIVLLDKDGKEIAVAIAQATSDWMTTDFVPFKATLEFQPTTSEGTIVFKKDNPSGLPEHDDSLSFSVLF